MSNPDHEPGVRLSEAHRCYCRPDLLERFDNAGARAGRSENRFRVVSPGSSPRESPRSAAVPEYRLAQKSAISDLVAKLIDDRLIAKGFVIGPDGRDPEAIPRLIPKDVLTARDVRINWQKETISGNGLAYTGVRLYSPYEAPEPAVSLVGESLAECFRLVVVDDWVRQEMEEPIFSQFPKWKIGPNSYRLLPANHWPVRFEDWSETAYMVRRHVFPVIVLGERHPDPPEDVARVRRRIEAQVRHLIEWLRDGTLIADGIVEPKDHKLKRQTIPPDWWRQKGVELNHAENSIWNTEDPKQVRVFSDIRIVAPATPAQAPDHTGQQGQTPPARALRAGSGELEVWNCLQQWKKQDPDFHKGRKKSAIARTLGEKSQFAGYAPQTLETYVGRALRNPSF